MPDKLEADDLLDPQEDDFESDEEEPEDEPEEEPAVEPEAEVAEQEGEEAPIPALPVAKTPYKPPYRANSQESQIVNETAQELLDAGFAETEEAANQLAAIMLKASGKMSSLATGALVQSNAYYAQEVGAQYPEYSQEYSGRIFSNLKTMNQEDQGTPHGVNTAIAMTLLQDAEDDNLSFVEVMKRHVAKMEGAPKKQAAAILAAPVAPRRNPLETKAARLIPTSSGAPPRSGRQESAKSPISIYTKYEEAARRERSR